MKYIDITGMDYFGFDIVEELVIGNTKNIASQNIHFGVLDIEKDTLPKADLMLCRDWQIHFPEQIVLRGLRNIVARHSTYLLSTTMPELDVNRDVEDIVFISQLTFK